MESVQCKIARISNFRMWVWRVIFVHFSEKLTCKRLGNTRWQAFTLEFLINMQDIYLILTDFSFLHALIRNYTFIEFHEIFTAYETSRYLLEKSSILVTFLARRAYKRDNPGVYFHFELIISLLHHDSSWNTS